MVIVGWRDTITEAAPPSWRDTIKESAPSTGESLGRGFAQGSTLGFSDEGGAGLYALAEKYLPNSVQNYMAGTNPATEHTTDKSLSQLYTENRDMDRAKNKAAQTANPGAYLGGEIGGAVLSNFIPGVRAAGGVGQGGIAGMGYSDKEDLGGVLLDTAKGSGLGAGVDVGGKVLGSLAGKISPYVDDIGNAIKKKADDFYIKATGATGREAERFSPEAASELRNYVKFGDSPENIANRLEKAVDESGKRIGAALDTATEKGAKVDLVKYLEDSESKVTELRSMGKLSEANALESQTNGLIEQINKMGVTEVSPSFMENVKRESQAGINYFADAKPAIAGKKLGASMQRSAVEDSVRGLDEGLANQFKEDKRLFGLLSPIQDAAAKRASTLNQSPFGGLGDAAAMAAAGSPAGAIGRRLAAPRLASSAAVSMDKIGDLVKATPQIFGKYSQVLQGASARGPQAVASTHFILQQTDPEYRAIINRVAGNEQNQGDENAFSP